jgi:4-diphosphocytidyl-2-C-methyl-D-erythritol kinase
MQTTPDELKIQAPAKINLFLEILGKRGDSYHEIRSLMQPIGLFDTLWIKAIPKGLKVRCPGHPELENESNLIVKAVKVLEKELDRSLPFSVRLKKKIPIGAGLGGGSSNAAAVLTGVNRILGDPVRSDRMQALAAQIGSDVPFFLGRETALISGRGEVIEPWPNFPVYWYVLIYPGFSISTSWAYKQVKFPLTRREKTTNIKRLKTKRSMGKTDRFFNDLEDVVTPFYPKLQMIKNTLRDQGCSQALMSGSGSTMFGIWETGKPAKEAFRRLKQQGWREVFLAKGL